MPVAAGIVLWMFTGSVISLCLAALGPLMMFASFADQARTRRREGRLASAETTRAWEQAEEELAALQVQETRRRSDLLPDVATWWLREPLRGSGELSASTPLVIGHGSVPSGIRTSGGSGERARHFQDRSRVLPDAPLDVALGGGVCVRGAPSVTAAVARALVLQLCLRFDPSRLSVVSASVEDRCFSALPHRRGQQGSFVLGVGALGERPRDADGWIVIAAPGEELPAGIPTVLDVDDPSVAVLRTAEGERRIRAEGISAEQFIAIVDVRLTAGVGDAGLPDGVAAGELTPPPPSPSSLPAVIGRAAGEDLLVDLVEDGPHAIVTGTTGTGKSELLISWVLGIAAVTPPDAVSFVLADFKGGTAFEPLRRLPHVAAVITDLDENGARRGVRSLVAELRRREGLLAAAGVRDVRDADIGRLVIVVDEYAALVNEHPDLAAVFIDIAARGRALGMHLVLGTQRASGVIRDALAANCPLRLSLRVSDAADSRAVIGSTAAAELPGGPASRGLCLVRRPRDREVVPIRVALTASADIERIAERWPEAGARAVSPWLPELPTHLALGDLLSDLPSPSHSGRVVWGLADVPDQQTQIPVEVAVGAERGVGIVGAAGSGRTTALAAIAAQRADAVWLPSDLESLWDAIAAFADGVEPLPPLLLVDNLDARFAELPGEYAVQFGQRWEHILRVGAGTTFVVSSMRVAGTVGRLLDMVPRRALLRLGSRVEHVAAGGASATFDERRPPGRVLLDGREAQLALVDTPPDISSRPREAEQWVPRAELVGMVTGGLSRAVTAVRAAYPGADVWSLCDGDAKQRAAALRDDPAPLPQIILGDGELWQREWTLWQRLRGAGEVVVRAERPTELRQLAGVRELPPFARLHAGRVWVVRGDEPPVRRTIPALVPRTSAENPPVGVAPRPSPEPRSSESGTRRSRRLTGARDGREPGRP